MIKISNPAVCSGCTACSSICGHNAITMQPDNLGFKYPVVDVSKCVECGLCEKVCPFHNDYKTPENLSEPISYGVRLKDSNELIQSQSGGAFTAITDVILSMGGVVYGCALSETFKAEHRCAHTIEERNAMRGSKYVQSDLDNTFRNIRADLAAGKTVLFSGTPCQTAGLQSFIPEKLKGNLYVVDLVCHGTPSPAIWADYIKHIEHKFHDTVETPKFRDKKMGWRIHRETFKLTNSGTKSQTSYTYLFYAHLMLRESCYNCKFCNLRRTGDVTIADLWGSKDFLPDWWDDNKGISLILCNTEKGQELFAKAQPSLEVRDIDIHNMLQPNLQHPTPRPELRSRFEQEYAKHGFNYVFYKYGQDGWRFKTKKTFNRILRIPKAVLRRIKKLVVSQ